MSFTATQKAAYMGVHVHVSACMCVGCGVGEVVHTRICVHTEEARGQP